MNITIVAGARPNFMKVAPIIKAIVKFNQSQNTINFRLVHTGQHYDYNMSGSFFDELAIPKPDANLGAGSGTQAEQTAAIMVGFEKDLLIKKPDVVVVVGDVTSTMACSITAKKLCIEVVHVEAGIRSGDLSMPEEINRIVTDSISDHYFTTSEKAGQNLKNSGVPDSKIHFVGNTMIDTLLDTMPRFKSPEIEVKGEKIKNNEYFVITLHRPSNVDDLHQLKSLLNAVLEGSADFPIIFPVHPRTAKLLQGEKFDNERLILIDPLPYLEFNYLVKFSKGVITDSGGITEETTIMGIPCITLRNSTERPETISVGTNELVGNDREKLKNCLELILSGKWKRGGIPPLWDGKSAERIVQKLFELYNN